MSCKKGVPKTLKKLSEKYLCRSQESQVKVIPCEFYGIFGNIYFVEHLRTHTCVKWSNEKNVLTSIFRENHRWWCPLKYSCRIEGLEHGCLQFYLKGDQSQILSCKTCEVLQSFSFTQHYLLLGICFWFPATFLRYRYLYQQYINSVTTSCLGTPDIATCKWSTLLALKIFKGNNKIQVKSNILGLRLTQRTKWYVAEAVAPRCSAKNVPWNIWKNSQENACTGDFLKLNL